MEDDADSVPEIVNITNNANPLLTLVTSVINLMDNDKERVILTNLQLMNILKIEFDIDVKKKSEVESEIYLNVIKYFLKTWPCWDQLHDIIQNYSKKDAEVCIIKNCANLKLHLEETLTTAKNLLQPCLIKVQNEISSEHTLESSQDAAEVVMKINCTRAQLNQLIFRRPDPSTGTIFNISDGPKKICTDHYTLQQIVNNPKVQMTFMFPGFECYRINSTAVERHIVNMKRPENVLFMNQSHPLNEGVYFRKTLSKTVDVERETIISFLKELDNMASIRMNNVVIIPIFRLFVNEFLADFNRAPTVIKAGEHRFNFHRYKYIRHITVDPPESEMQKELEGINNNNFDLNLQELLTPQVDFQITKLCLQTLEQNKKAALLQYNNPLSKLVLNGCWAKVECLPCQKKFEIKSNLSDLLQHFEDCHEFEFEHWTCTGCQLKFSVQYLSSHRWTHDCVVPS